MHSANFISLNACIRKEERPKIHNLSFYLRELVKEQIKFKVEEREEYDGGLEGC